jgi:hypothetical protein
MDNILCPICNIEHHLIDYFLHLRNDHPETLLTMTTLFLNDYNDNDIFNILQFNNYDQEDDTYEDLSELCERIGNVTIGVKDINDSAPATICLENIENNKCPICFENFNSIISKNDNFIRKIKKCKHLFCSECITTWLSDHKTCPICKIDLED